MVRLALTFAPNVDVAGIATVALAVVTLAAVLVSARALLQTREAIRLSRMEVEQAHRPVLIPRNDRETLPVGGGQQPAAPQVIGGVLQIAVKNIGAGPALNLQCGIRLLGNDGNPTTASGTRQWIDTNVGFGASDSGFVYVKVDRLAMLPCSLSSFSTRTSPGSVGSPRAGS